MAMLRTKEFQAGYEGKSRMAFQTTSGGESTVLSTLIERTARVVSGGRRDIMRWFSLAASGISLQSQGMVKICVAHLMFWINELKVREDVKSLGG